MIDYVYGKSTSIDSARFFQCFGTDKSFKIKNITKFDKTLATFFWSIISKIEVFFKVKVTKEWVILTISTDKKGNSRERVLANKDDIINSLGMNFLGHLNVFDRRLNEGETYEERIEEYLYRTQFIEVLPYPAREALELICTLRSLFRDLRYTEITAEEFGIAFSSFKALQKVITTPSDFRNRQTIRGKAATQRMAYSHFLARVICHKCELEQKTRKQMTYDFSKLAYDETTGRVTTSEAEVLKEDSAGASMAAGATPAPTAPTSSSIAA